VDLREAYCAGWAAKSRRRLLRQYERNRKAHPAQNGPGHAACKERCVLSLMILSRSICSSVISINCLLAVFSCRQTRAMTEATVSTTAIAARVDHSLALFQGGHTKSRARISCGTPVGDYHFSRAVDRWVLRSQNCVCYPSPGRQTSAIQRRIHKRRYIASRRGRFCLSA